ncbi:MAG: DUF2207 domain-containing protein, partial [Eggerthellaceae bacterium]|nr:DUF2207 domain-containing protein [Eggerthellaceae bacterium]
IVSVLSLARRGVVQIGQGSYCTEKREAVDDYFIRLSDEYAQGFEHAETLSQIDISTLELLFRTGATKDRVVWLAGLLALAKKSPARLLGSYRSWQANLSAVTARYDFFDRTSRHVAIGMGIAGAVLLFLAVILWTVGVSWFAIICIAITAVTMLVLANYLPRRTQAGINLIARCKALRNWLRDLPSLDEPLDIDGRKRAILMTYAYLFGVEAQAQRALITEEPSATESEGADIYSEEERRRRRRSTHIVSWQRWFVSGKGPTGFMMPSFVTLFDAILQ